MEALGRVELPTFGLGNRCSIHLSYRAVRPDPIISRQFGQAGGTRVLVSYPKSAVYRVLRRRCSRFRHRVANLTSARLKELRGLRAHIRVATGLFNRDVCYSYGKDWLRDVFVERATGRHGK
jgi:hypothetical protein